MVVVLLAVVVGLAASLASGGRPRHLAGLTLRAGWLLVLAVAGELGAATGLVDGRAGFLVATLAGLVLLVRNPRLPGLELVVGGLLLNTVAVLANGGRMPVSLTALGRIGTGNAALLSDPSHVAAGSHTSLRLLTDRIAVPLPHGCGEVLSPGDVALAAGLGLLMYAALRPPPRPAALGPAGGRVRGHAGAAGSSGTLGAWRRRAASGGRARTARPTTASGPTPERPRTGVPQAAASP